MYTNYIGFIKNEINNYISHTGNIKPTVVIGTKTYKTIQKMCKELINQTEITTVYGHSIEIGDFDFGIVIKK